jgi:hypothetical protein
MEDGGGVLDPAVPAGYDPAFGPRKQGHAGPILRNAQREGWGDPREHAKHQGRGLKRKMRQVLGVSRRRQP